MKQFTEQQHYGGTSDNGHSEEWETSLQWTNCSPPAYIVYTFLPPKKGQPLNNGQKANPQCVHYQEVPLYTVQCVTLLPYLTQPTVKELAALSSENRDLRESAERDKATIEALVQKLKRLQDKVCILEHTLHYVDGFAKSFRCIYET